MKKIILSLVAGALFSTSVSILAADRYVSDSFYIQLRSDKSNAASVIQSGLISGTKLEFLREERAEDGQLWSYVQTQEGVDGWVRSSNLINKPTAATQLARLSESARNSLTLQNENETLKQQLQTLQETHQQLLTDTEDMRQAATTALNLEDENTRLHSEYQILQTRVDTLNAENEYLRSNDNYNQWLYGGLLVLVGILASFALQAFGRRRRQSDWN